MITLLHFRDKTPSRNLISKVMHIKSVTGMPGPLASKKIKR